MYICPFLGFRAVQIALYAMNRAGSIRTTNSPPILLISRSWAIPTSPFQTLESNSIPGTFEIDLPGVLLVLLAVQRIETRAKVAEERGVTRED
ncbi:hypothetical protein PM082_004846 [Marasmius tenuissimus]|nr:hypothetical protein PM082_004846 [Marasmius tenuissimus]